MFNSNTLKEVVKWIVTISAVSWVTYIHIFTNAANKFWCQ